MKLLCCDGSTRAAAPHASLGGGHLSQAMPLPEEQDPFVDSEAEYRTRRELATYDATDPQLAGACQPKLQHLVIQF